MIKYIYFFTFFFFSNTLSAQYTVSPSPIKWYDINQAIELNKKEARPILIDVYTDWCSWCKHMMKTTFSNQGIANYINRNFYPVRFNAETTDTIEFKGKKYFNRNIGRKPTHDLAISLLEGRLSYPSIVYFDRNGKKSIVPGFKEPKDIEPTLIYMVENLSNFVSLSEFTINFMFTYPAPFEKDHSIFKIPQNIRPDTLGVPNWIKPKKAITKNKKKRKPYMIFFYTNWCINCKVMEKTTIGNKEISDLLNENFNIIKIDAATQDTITFLGKQYKGTGKNNPHELTLTLLQKNTQMPAIVFFDETGKLLSSINGFINVDNIKAMIDFFNDKKYETLSYNEYLKTLKSSVNNTNNSQN